MIWGLKVKTGKISKLLLPIDEKKSEYFLFPPLHIINGTVVRFNFYTDRETLQCNGGYVMTGMKLKTLDADEGKYITGVRIKCTKLLEE